MDLLIPIFLWFLNQKRFSIKRPVHGGNKYLIDLLTIIQCHRGIRGYFYTNIDFNFEKKYVCLDSNCNIPYIRRSNQKRSRSFTFLWITKIKRTKLMLIRRAEELVLGSRMLLVNLFFTLEKYRTLPCFSSIKCLICLCCMIYIKRICHHNLKARRCMVNVKELRFSTVIEQGV